MCMIVSLGLTNDIKTSLPERYRSHKKELVNVNRNFCSSRDTRKGTHNIGSITNAITTSTSFQSFHRLTASIMLHPTTVSPIRKLHINIIQFILCVCVYGKYSMTMITESNNIKRNIVKQWMISSWETCQTVNFSYFGGNCWSNCVRCAFCMCLCVLGFVFCSETILYWNSFIFYVDNFIFCVSRDTHQRKL